MPFPTVRTSPWIKGKRTKRNIQLWPEAFWKELVSLARAPELIFQLIGDMNELMYGRR